MLEPTIYRTRSEHANHYTTDGVSSHRNDDKPTIYRNRSEHANHYATDGVNSHRNDDNINMDETKEPVNDRNELTNLHYTSRQYIDHHTEDKKPMLFVLDICIANLIVCCVTLEINTTMFHLNC